MQNSEKTNSIERSREYLANERTFLAWIRTSIALMSFGFVIVKFALFLKQLSVLLESHGMPPRSHSAIVGVIMVAIGVVVAVFAFIQYKSNYGQLSKNLFKPSLTLPFVVTFILISGGLVLIIYLMASI